MDGHRYEQSFNCLDTRRLYEGSSDDPSPYNGLLLYDHSSLDGPEVSERQPGRICNKCGREFPSTKCLMRHIRNVHLSTKIPCEKCEKMYANADSYREHVKCVHERSTKTTCKQCGKLLATKKSAAKHVRDKHEESMMTVCIECGKLLADRNLKQHIRTVHEQSTREICGICGETLSTNYTLVRHMRTIHNMMPPPGGLEEAEDTNSRPLFSCKLCKKFFTSKNDLDCHERNKPFGCRVCEKCFDDEELFQYHVHRQHPDQVYMCSCGKGYSRRDNLNVHQRQCTELREAKAGAEE